MGITGLPLKYFPLVNIVLEHPLPSLELWMTLFTIHCKLSCFLLFLPSTNTCSFSYPHLQSEMGLLIQL